MIRFEPAASETLYFHRKRQYLVTALTGSTGAVVERCENTAFCEVRFLSATCKVLTDSAQGNHCTYTGPEWDKAIGIFHFRARMYDAESGRDPIKFPTRHGNLFEHTKANPFNYIDGLGLTPCGVDVATNLLYSIFITILQQLAEWTRQNLDKITMYIYPHETIVDCNCEGIGCRLNDSRIIVIPQSRFSITVLGSGVSFQITKGENSIDQQSRCRPPSECGDDSLNIQQEFTAKVENQAGGQLVSESMTVKLMFTTGIGYSRFNPYEFDTVTETTEEEGVDDER